MILSDAIRRLADAARGAEAFIGKVLPPRLAALAKGLIARKPTGFDTGYALFAFCADLVIAGVFTVLLRGGGAELVAILIGFWLLRGVFWLLRLAWTAHVYFMRGERAQLEMMFLNHLRAGQFPFPRSESVTPAAYLGAISENEVAPAATRMRAVIMLDAIGKVAGQGGIAQRYLAERAFHAALLRYTRS